MTWRYRDPPELTVTSTSNGIMYADTFLYMDTLPSLGCVSLWSAAKKQQMMLNKEAKSVEHKLDFINQRNEPHHKQWHVTITNQS